MGLKLHEQGSSGTAHNREGREGTTGPGRGILLMRRGVDLTNTSTAHNGTARKLREDGERLLLGLVQFYGIFSEGPPNEHLEQKVVQN